MNIKKILLLVLIFITLFSCGKKTAGTPEEVFEKLSKADNYDEAKIYFTKGTIMLMDSAVSKGIIGDKDRAGYLPLFSKKTKWVITGNSNHENTADITLRFINHPVENLKGTDISYNLVREDGSWKIDLEKETKDALTAYVPDSAEKYLKDILK